MGRLRSAKLGIGAVGLSDIPLAVTRLEHDSVVAIQFLQLVELSRALLSDDCQW